jgi:hypothetical protein
MSTERGERAGRIFLFNGREMRGMQEIYCDSFLSLGVLSYQKGRDSSFKEMFVWVGFAEQRSEPCAT